MSETVRPQLRVERSLSPALRRRRAIFSFMLVAIGILLFVVQPDVVAAVRAGTRPAEWLWVGPMALFALAVFMVVDELVNARRGRSFGGRQMLKLVLVLGVTAVVSSTTFGEFRSRKAISPTSAATLQKLMRHRDARVRALVVDVAGWRQTEDRELSGIIDRGLEDRDPMVRDIAQHARRRTSASSAGQRP